MSSCRRSRCSLGFCGVVFRVINCLCVVAHKCINPALPTIAQIHSQFLLQKLHTFQLPQHTATHAMEVYSQDDLDRAFADLDHMLALERPEPHENGKCCNCGSAHLVRGGENDGQLVCAACAVLQPGVHLPPNYFYPLPRKYSNYKRIHHWHERISQLLLMESPIPDADFALIAAKLCDGSHSVLNKDSIRAVLRSLNMQLYIEKWLQIIYRITGIMPPFPGPMLVRQLDQLFIDLQRPFDAHKVEGRKNFLNYNYVFCRMFQYLGCPQFCMFFPLIKSKAKLRVLDSMWAKMAASLGWPVTPVQAVTPFAVRLESPALLRNWILSQLVLPRGGGRGRDHGRESDSTCCH